MGSLQEWDTAWPATTFAGGALVPEMGERRHADFLADAQQFLLSSGKVGMHCWLSG